MVETVMYISSIIYPKFNCNKEEKAVIKSVCGYRGLNHNTVEKYVNGVLCMLHHANGGRLNGLQKVTRFGLSKEIYKESLCRFITHQQ